METKGLVTFLVRKWQGLLPKKISFDGIIGVLLRPKRKRKRGFNQMDLIGTSLSASSGIPYCKDTLVRIKNTPAHSKKKEIAPTLLGMLLPLTLLKN